jgi:hypothetical protein
MREAEAEQIATFIHRIAENIDNESVIEQVGKEVLLLCSQFPVPEHFIIPPKNGSGIEGGRAVGPVFDQVT